MSIKRAFFPSLFLIAMLSNQIYAEYSNPTVPPFALITVPKAGSHLIIKALHFLTGGTPVWHTRFPSYFYIPIEDGFLYTHLCLSPQLEKDYDELPELKKIVMIRDLRDVCVSIVSQIHKGPWPGLKGEERTKFLELPFEDQLLYVINYDYDVKAVAHYAPNSLQVSIKKVAEQSIRYQKDTAVLTCRYENLVGSLGGGNDETQLEELKNISRFLNTPYSEEDLKAIASLLYGNEINPFGREGFQNFTSTFQRGKIGSWKESFQEIHKEAFKTRLGEALIELGYEQDLNW